MGVGATFPVSVGGQCPLKAKVKRSERRSRHHHYHHAQPRTPVVPKTSHAISTAPPATSYITSGQWIQWWPRINGIVKRLLAFELNEQNNPPVHIVRTSTIPNCTVHPDLGGRFACDYSYTLRPFIRGNEHGPTILLADSADYFKQYIESESALYKIVLAVVVHEFCHAVAEYPAWLVEPRKPIIVPIDALTDIDVEMLALDPSMPSFRPAWFGHDSRFIRILLHATYRVFTSEMQSLPPLMAWEHCGYNDPLAYVAAVKPEFESMRDIPLSQINNTPSPALMDIWQNDTGYDPKTLKPLTDSSSAS